MRESGLASLICLHSLTSCILVPIHLASKESVSFCRLLALRKAEKEEERRAREKIKQKLEEDKVYTLSYCVIFCCISIVLVSFLI